MKRWISIVMAVVFLFTMDGMQAWATSDTTAVREDSMKVLLVGNSMSRYKHGGKLYNIEEPLEALAKKGGHELDVTTIAHGGAWLQYYAQDSEKYGSYYRQLSKALKNQTWDYIILQGFSKRIVDNYETKVYPSLQKIIKRIERYQPQAQVMLYMTYGYNDGSKKKVNGKYRYLTEGEMEDYLAAGYFDMGERSDVPVIPVGMQLERCRNLYPEIELYTKDGRHACGAGYYLAACTFYFMLYGSKPDGSGLDVGAMTLPDEERKKLEQLVTDTMQIKQEDLQLQQGKIKRLSVRIASEQKESNRISYRSLNEDIARVNKKTGRVIAVNPGRTLVIAESQSGLQAAIAVYVKCKAPQKVRATILEASTKKKNGRVQLTWEETEEAKSYRIYRSNRKNGSYVHIATIKGLTYTDKGGKPGQRMYYKIKAVHKNKKCNSLYSKAVRAK